MGKDNRVCCMDIYTTHYTQINVLYCASKRKAHEVIQLLYPHVVGVAKHG